VLKVIKYMVTLYKTGTQQDALKVELVFGVASPSFAVFINMS
jgi:hypothetical protein